MTLTNKDKIVFLDVDGVLNSEEYYSNRWSNGRWTRGHELDPKAIDVLRRIVEDTGAKVVVSSAWRLCSMDALNAEINPAGIYPIDTTELRYDFSRSRAKEIKNWLDAHPQITNYVVLDDMSMDIEEIRQHHVHTSMDEGLVERHLAVAKNILNGKLIK